MRNGDKRWETMRNGEKRWETVRNGEKRGLVWSGHENMIYTGINAQNLYIYWHKCSCHNCDGQRTECEDRAILKQNSQKGNTKLPWNQFGNLLRCSCLRRKFVCNKRPLMDDTIDFFKHNLENFFRNKIMKYTLSIYMTLTWGIWSSKNATLPLACFVYSFKYPRLMLPTSLGGGSKSFPATAIILRYRYRWGTEVSFRKCYAYCLNVRVSQQKILHRDAAAFTTKIRIDHVQQQYKLKT